MTDAAKWWNSQGRFMVHVGDFNICRFYDDCSDIEYFTNEKMREKFKDDFKKDSDFEWSTFIASLPMKKWIKYKETRVLTPVIYPGLTEVERYEERGDSYLF